MNTTKKWFSFNWNKNNFNGWTNWTIDDDGIRDTGINKILIINECGMNAEWMI